MYASSTLIYIDLSYFAPKDKYLSKQGANKNASNKYVTKSACLPGAYNHEFDKSTVSMAGSY